MRRVVNTTVLSEHCEKEKVCVWQEMREDTLSQVV